MATNLSDFCSRFRVEDAEILILNEQISKSGTYSNYFYSYCILNDDLYSLNVSYPTVPYYRLHNPEFREDQELNQERLFLNRYRRTDAGYEQIECVNLGGGEDPRVVSNETRAFAIIITSNNLIDDEMRLYDLVKRRMIPITVDEPGFEYGKNWQPYLHGDELYCVHQLTPFRLLKIDTDTGKAVIVSEINVNFNMPCVLPQFGENFSIFRGGSNAIKLGDKLFGIGRAATVGFRHSPFFWSSDKAQIELSFTSFFSGFYNRGYNIIDPTCLFSSDEDLYVGLCCTERDWAHTQLISNFLIVFRGGSATKPRQETLTDFFSRRTPTEINGKANLDRHLFFCIDMPYAIPNRIEFSGRLSKGDPGHLVFGPYLRIETPGKYCAELSYLTKSSPSHRVGTFDVVANNSWDNFSNLGEVELESTDGHLKQAIVTFDTTDHQQWMLETRVFVEEDVELVAFHIRTWRLKTDQHKELSTTWSPLDVVKNSSQE